MTSDVDVPSGDTATAVPPEGRRVRKRSRGPRLTRRQRLSRWDLRLSPYLYISPFFVLFLLVGMFPLVYTAYVSVFDWGLLSGKGEFIGLDNYTVGPGGPDLRQGAGQHVQHLPALLGAAGDHRAGPGGVAGHPGSGAARCGG